MSWRESVRSGAVRANIYILGLTGDILLCVYAKFFWFTPDRSPSGEVWWRYHRN